MSFSEGSFPLQHPKRCPCFLPCLKSGSLDRLHAPGGEQALSPSDPQEAQSDQTDTLNFLPSLRANHVATPADKSPGSRLR